MREYFSFTWAWLGQFRYGKVCLFVLLHWLILCIKIIRLFKSPMSANQAIVTINVNIINKINQVVFAAYEVSSK